MNRTEHLLCCLAEEANEVAHRVSKALRFGLEEIQDGQSLTNAERVVHEFADMLAIVELLEEIGVLGRSTDTHAIERKKSKVIAYMEYAEQRGTLVPQGWKSLPPKMTGAMHLAFVEAGREYMRETGGINPDVMYRAAFDAAEGGAQ